MLSSFFPSGCSALAAALLFATVVTPAAAEDGAAFVRFEDVTDAAGLTWHGRSWSSAWADFDGDGLLDLWVGNHFDGAALYRNLGDGTFAEESALRGMALKADLHGAAWADFDGDGDQDLLILKGADRGFGSKSNALFVNRGGFFIDEAEVHGLGDPLGRGRTPLWLDWNGDGLLDVVVTNAARADAPSRLLMGSPDGTFEDDPGFALGASAYAVLGRLAMFPSPVVFAPGSGSFAIFETMQPCCTDLRTDVRLPGLAARFDAVLADLTGDNAMDLFTVAAAFLSDHRLVNERTLDAHFEAGTTPPGIRLSTAGAVLAVNIGPFLGGAARRDEIRLGAAGLHPPSTALLLDPADPDLHGFPEIEPGVGRRLYIGYDVERGLWRVVAGLVGDRVGVRLTSEGGIHDVEPEGFAPFAPRHPPALLTASGSRLVHADAAAGLTEAASCTSIGAGDFDNDGDIDLYLVCTATAGNLANVFLENLGDGTFRTVAEHTGAEANVEGRGDHVSVADYDGDGFLDLFVANGHGDPPTNRGPNKLFRNLGNDNDWLQLDLVGTLSNRDAIGARVVLRSGGRTQVRLVGSEMHRGAQNMRRVHFGLGAGDAPVHVRIEWPSGLVQDLRHVQTRQILVVEEGQPVALGDLLLDGRLASSDALLLLQAAVELRRCTLRVCDVIDSGNVGVLDALTVLARSTQIDD